MGGGRVLTTLAATDRLCASCGCVLSRYNAEPTCGPCQERERAKWLDSLHDEPTPVVVERVPMLRERILEALASGPMTARQIAMATRVHEGRVRGMMSHLVARGDVESTGPRKHVPRVYRLSEDRAA